jgi:hypothetical protein
MLVKRYQELHTEYLKALVDYHNAYIKCILGKQSRFTTVELRKTLKVLKTLNGEMAKELQNVRRAKMELYKDHYQTHRQKGKNKNVNNTSN